MTLLGEVTMHVIAGHRRQRLLLLCELEANLAYRVRPFFKNGGGGGGNLKR